MTWLISVGRWNDWPDTTNYYHLLADAFRAGQTHLLIEPDPKLLALEDPYDFENRKAISQVWDATLYQGKYYLYWGPVPAIVVIMIESFIDHPVGDNLLLWLFSLGTIFWVVGILRTIFTRHFNHLPAWVFIYTSFSVLFVNPFPWMVARPAVYEVAIQSGQFFFLGGLFWLLDQDFGNRASPGKMLLLAIFWVLAIASRVSLMSAIIPLCLIISFQMSRARRSVADRINTDASLMLFWLPLLIGAAGLAYYNYERFGSVFELGHRYALSSWKMSESYRGFVTSFNNVGANIYNYGLNPFRVLDTFPFIKPKWGTYSVPFLRIVSGASYTTEQVTGILVSAPVILFSGVPLIISLSRIWNNLDTEKQDRSHINPFHHKDVSRIYAYHFLSVILILLPLLLFHANSMRYMMDFVPTLLILTAVGFWSITGTSDWPT